MTHELVRDPNDLARFFVERANAGDLEGLVALFEPHAVVSSPDGPDFIGHEAFRGKYAAALERHTSASAISRLR
jgi:ketosteroid isomerase-like protein